MKKTGIKNPFDASVSLVTAQTVKKTDGQAKKETKSKSTDKIKIFLACVPSLEDAKNDLKVIVDEVENSIKGDVQSFIEQISSIQNRVLEFTQMAIAEGVNESVEEPAPMDGDVKEVSLPDILMDKLSGSEIAKIVLSDVNFNKNGKILLR